MLGCEVRADLMNGKDIIATAAEYFNVCPTKEVQRVGIHTSANPDNFTWPEKAYLDTIPGKVAKYVSLMQISVEHYACLPDYYTDLAPQEDVWCNSYWESKAALQKAVEEEHKYGMKALIYEASVATSRHGAELQKRHPEWFLYKENGQLCGEGGDVSKLGFPQKSGPARRYIFCYRMGTVAPSRISH